MKSERGALLRAKAEEKFAEQCSALRQHPAMVRILPSSQRRAARLIELA